MWRCAALTTRPRRTTSTANRLDALDALDALAQRCGSLVAIKGIDLARRVYPNVATRPMHDIDVWVSDERLSDAERALAVLGYRPAMPEMSKKLTRLVKHARLYVGGPRDSVGIDLHWSLVGNENDRRAPSLAWFRERASATLEPTAHLLYLAAHMKLQHYDDALPLIWLAVVEFEGIFPAPLVEVAEGFVTDATDADIGRRAPIQGHEASIELAQGCLLSAAQAPDRVGASCDLKHETVGAPRCFVCDAARLDEE